MRTGKGKFKERKRILSKTECFIYQLIESCLKLDLDRTIALRIINLIFESYPKYLNSDNKRIISIQKMDYRNYRRYVNELMAMSPIHKAYFKQYDHSNPDYIVTKQKSKDKRQFENLLFLLSENDKKLPYRKYKIVDTDDLVFRALIQIDKSYTF